MKRESFKSIILNSKSVLAAVVAATALLPLTLFAAGEGLIDGEAGDFGTFIKGLSTVINDYLIPFVIALAVLAFVYGVFTYFIAGGADEDKRKEGRNLMLYAIIGFVAIVALWGIVSFVAGAFGFEPGGTIPNIPGVDTGSGGGGNNSTTVST